MTQLTNHTLHLADTNLILAQRNSEWCAHGPILEQDIAITNISLDLLGQARNFYQYAAELINEMPADQHNSSNQLINQSTNQLTNQSTKQLINTATEDSLAYHRTEREFKNLLICELPNIDWAQTILRQFFYSTYQYGLYEVMKNGKDTQLAAIAAKSIKETTYHVKWSREWVLRLGDGTEESHQRMVKALGNLWPYTGEFFIPADYEIDDSFNHSVLKNTWQQKVEAVLSEATLNFPTPGKGQTEVYMHSGGKNGVHTENLGFILAEMQSLQRTYPGAEW